MVVCSGVLAFAFAVIYLIAMARIAALMQRETRIQGVGIDRPNAQMNLVRVVFLKHHLDKTFAQEHVLLLTTARASGGVGLLLTIALFVGILLGYAG